MPNEGCKENTSTDAPTITVWVIDARVPSALVTSTRYAYVVPLVTVASSKAVALGPGPGPGRGAGVAGRTAREIVKPVMGEPPSFATDHAR